MRDPSNDWRAGRVIAPVRGWNRGKDDAMIVHLGIAKAYVVQFFHQQLAQLQLAGRTGIGHGFFVGLRVDAHIPAETVQQGVHFL